MAVNLSPVWGAGAQLFDNSGNVLTGGKIYTYLAGTTTPAATYTSSSGNTANSNPIVANSAGRVSNEIWLTLGQSYKFVLKDSNDVLIGTYDDIEGVSSNSSNIEYDPAAGSLLYPGPTTVKAALDAITDDESGSSVIGFVQPDSGAIKRTVESKLQDTVSVKDFGATGDGTTDDTGAFNAADDSSTGAIYVPEGTYILDGAIITSKKLFGPGTLKWKSGVAGTTPMVTLADGASLEGLTLNGNSTANASVVLTFSSMVYVTGQGSKITDCNFFEVPSTCVLTPASTTGETGSDLFIENCYIKNTNKYCFVFRSNRCSVSNCKFFGTGLDDGHAIRYGIFSVDNTNYPGCAVTGGSVTGCNFQYVNSGSCLFEWNAYNITFTGNSSNYTTGVKCEYQSGQESHNIVISGNYFGNTRFTPIVYNFSTNSATIGTTPNNPNPIAGFNCSFSDNVCFETSGITVGNGSIVSNNVFKECGTASVGAVIQTLENGTFAGIYGNVLEPRSTDNPASTITCFSGTIIGNKIKGVAGQTTYAINAQDANNVIKDNHIDTAAYGVRLVSTTTNTYVAGNTYANITTAALLPTNNTITNLVYDTGVSNLYVPNVTIASGVATIGAQMRVNLDTEGSAATDDLNTISGGYIGQIIILKQASASRDVTVKTGTGNISLTGGDYNINTTTRTITLIYDGDNWTEVARTV